MTYRTAIAIAFSTACAAMAAADTAILTNASDVAAMITKPSITSCGFELRANVMQTLIAGSITEIALEDNSGGVIVKGEATSADLSPGDVVRVSGWLNEGLANVPQASFTNVARISSGAAPQPRIADADALFRGDFDWRLVRMRGVVREVMPSELSSSWVIMIAHCDGSPVYMSTPRREGLVESLKSLVESTVEVDCVCTPRDGSQRARVGRVLHFSGMRDVRVIHSAPDDPFSAPDIGDIGNMQPSEIANLGRHRVVGSVLAAWDERHALLRSDEGHIARICFRDGGLPKPGDSIEVSGFPESDLHHINLTDAKWRRCGEPSPVGTNAIEISARDVFPKTGATAFETRYHGKTVRMAGKLRSVTTVNSSRQILQLESDSLSISVCMSGLGDYRAELAIGSRISVTGVCVLNIENWHPRMTFPRIDGFFIVPRRPADIVVLSRPAWWTPGRLLGVISILLVAIVAILIWNRGLQLLANRKCRELLREQTGHLKASLKAEERTRLAVELHDSLAQNITGVSMEIETALRLQDEGLSEVVRHVSVADKALKSCRNELRNTLWDLRSQALDERDLRTAIERTLRPHVDGIRLDVAFDAQRSMLADNTAHDILCMIRELTINAVRHGEASEISVSGQVRHGSLVFSVADNGHGFSPERCPGVQEGHFGLQGIRDRLGRLSGSISFSVPDAGGTKATVTIPIPPQLQV